MGVCWGRRGGVVVFGGAKMFWGVGSGFFFCRWSWAFLVHGWVGRSVERGRERKGMRGVEGGYGGRGRGRCYCDSSANGKKGRSEWRGQELGGEERRGRKSKG